MDAFSSFDAPWVRYPAVVLVLLGLVLCWRGLRGGPRGERGLLRRRARLVGRIEGFRLVVVGLVLAGFGGAWFWQLRWLFFLAIGIGAVEILESSVIIATMRRDRGRATTERV